MGWEKNPKGAMGPRSVNLSECMDPKRYYIPGISLHTSKRFSQWYVTHLIDFIKTCGVFCRSQPEADALEAGPISRSG